MSRQMLVGWITLIIAVLALPQVTDLIPASYMPWAACASGVLTLVFRWLGGALGANPLSLAGVLALAAGILGIPDFISLIPVAWMPFVTGAAGILTLIMRFVVGQSPTDPAPPVNALLHTGRP